MPTGWEEVCRQSVGVWFQCGWLNSTLQAVSRCICTIRWLVTALVDGNMCNQAGFVVMGTGQECSHRQPSKAFGRTATSEVGASPWPWYTSNRDFCECCALIRLAVFERNSVWARLCCPMAGPGYVTPISQPQPTVMRQLHAHGG